MADLAHPKLVAAIVAAIIAVAAIWISISIARWRRISWRDHMDTQVSAMSKEARDSGPWAIWKVLTQHEEVADPSLVLLRIRNSGLRGITRADVRRPLTFSFPGRVVREFTVTDCHGVSRQDIQPPGDLGSPQTLEDTIALPRFPLRRRAGFKLLVLLSGPGRGIIVNGRLRRGNVLHDSRLRGPLTQNIAFGSALLLLVGIQAGITFDQSATLPSYCASGRLALEGSTAFFPTAQTIATQYNEACPGASVSVSGIATFNGLNNVAAEDGTAGPAPTGTADAPQPGTQYMAMSDGQAPKSYSALVGNPVAVIFFVVVVNKADHIYNLTTTQLQGIWAGKITNWEQVGGPNLKIKVVARTSTSGTRRTFDTKVLRGTEPAFTSYDCEQNDAVKSAKFIRCEESATDALLQKVDDVPGAIGYAQISDAAKYLNVSKIQINGWDANLRTVSAYQYPYWTDEYLYTADHPAPGSLEAGFLAYMDTSIASDILYSGSYVPCVDRGKSLKATLCNPAIANRP